MDNKIDVKFINCTRASIKLSTQFAAFHNMFRFTCSIMKAFMFYIFMVVANATALTSLNWSTEAIPVTPMALALMVPTGGPKLRRRTG